MAHMNFANYHSLMQALIASGREIGSVEDYLEGKLGTGPLAVIRHDVDRRLSKAVAMAQVENQFGVRATYYFRTSFFGFPANTIHRVHALGHCIGYHYETLSQAHGRRDLALDLFASNLKRLRSLVDCRTVSAHGSPLNQASNTDLLTDSGLRQFDLLGDAVHSLAGSPLVYLTDTAGTWDASQALNLRDHIPQQADAPALPRSHAELLHMVATSSRSLYFSVHPERWAQGWKDAIFCHLLDSAASLVKMLLYTANRLGLRPGP